MVTPLKNTDSVDKWIRTEAFKHAYNEKTRSFIGKKYVKGRVFSAVPREFIALGHTKEKIALRLKDMLASGLTEDLIQDCNEKRIKAGELEASAIRRLLGTSPGDRDLGAAGDRGALSPSTDAAGILGITTSGNSGAGIYISSPASTDALGVGARAGVTSVSTATSGMGAKSGAVEKGKKPMAAMVEDEVEEKTHGKDFSIAGEPNRKSISSSTPLPPVSIADVDRAIADFVAAQLPGLSEVHPKTTPKLDTADDSKDIFSRGGSTPQRSRSPVSSILVSPPPPQPLDSDIPSLPFKLQHRILITLQSILENACYDFARKYYPTFLIRKGWDCPEAGELTHWTRGLSGEFRENPTRVVRESEHFPLALKGIDEIRHSAVHRVPVSGRDIQRLIEKARVFLHMLDASKRMRDHVDEINEIIERNILVVLDKRRKKEEKLRQELEKLEEWKRILELREVRAIRQAEHEEERIQRLFRDEVGQALDALGAEESVEYSVGTGAELENSSIGNTREEELAQSEAGVTLDVEESTPGQEEEYFHESEVWPGEGEDDGDEV